MDVKTLKANLEGLPDDAEVRVDHDYGTFSDMDVVDVAPHSDDGEQFVAVTVR